MKIRMRGNGGKYVVQFVDASLAFHDDYVIWLISSFFFEIYCARKWEVLHNYLNIQYLKYLYVLKEHNKNLKIRSYNKYDKVVVFLIYTEIEIVYRN